MVGEEEKKTKIVQNEMNTSKDIEVCIEESPKNVQKFVK